MDLIVALPTDHVDRPDEFVTGSAITEMSRHLEACGVAAAFVTDHPAPDDRWLAGGGHHALEPTVALSFVAAATTTLRLVTNIYVVVYRNPLLAAKTLASLDALSGGRLTVGVAAGYLRSEFAALGASFDGRSEALDEAGAVMRAAWTGESFVGSGVGWSARGNTILPRPTQQPGPPIWCGGNSKAAIRRAVAMGDGWLPFGTPPGMGGAVRTADISTLDALSARLDLLDELCAEHGRPARPTICFTPISTWAEPDRLLDEVAALEQLGVDCISLTLSHPTDAAATRDAWMAAVDGVSSALGLARP